MADVNSIISKAGLDSVEKLKISLEQTNKELQAGIVNAKAFTDTIAGAKTMGQLNRDTLAVAKANEQLRKSVLANQLQEEKLAAFRANEAAKEEARKAKALAAEKKALAEDEKRIAALERKANAHIRSEAANNGATISSGTVVNSSDISGGLAASQAAAIPVINQNTKAVYDNADAKKRLAFEALQAKEAEKANATALRNSVKEANAAKGSLDQRRLALTRLRATFDALNDAERKTPFGERLAKTIPMLNNQVLELEKSTGRAQRNVGNYGSAFGKAASTAWQGLKTIANILPGLGIAGLLGFALEPLLNYISTLDLFKTKISEVVKTRQMLNDVNLKGAQNAQQELTQLQLLYKTAQNTALSDTQRYNAAKKLQDLYPQTFKNYTNEQIQLGQTDKAYLSLASAILATARARASEAQIVENSTRILSDEQRMVDLQAEREKAVQRQSKAQSTFNRELEKAKGNALALQAVYANETVSIEQSKIAKIDKQINALAKDREILNNRNLKLTENIVSQQEKGADISGIANEKTKQTSEKVNKSAIAAVDAQIKIAQEQQKIFEEQVNNENFSYEARINALNNFVERSNKIAQLEAEKAKAGRKLSSNELLAIDQEQATKQTQIAIDAGNRLVKINQDNAKLIEQVRVFQNEKAIANLEKERDTELAILAQSYKLRGDFSEKAQEEYEQKRLAIVNKYAKEEIKLQFQQVEALINIRKKTGEDTSKLEAELAALRLKYQDVEVKEGEDKNKKRLDKEKELQSQLKQLYQETFDFAVALTNGMFERNISRLEKEKELATEKKDRDIENIEESTLSEEEKAEKIAVINSQAEAKQKEIDARIAAQKRKQAIADKAAALAQIAINTAVATTKTLGQTGIFGLPLTSILIAFGALQAATVLAQPIPEFRHGGTMQHDGIAKFGEEGSELRLNPDGSTELTPSSTTFGFVKKGTHFVTANKTKQILAKPEKLDYAGKSWDVSGVIASQNNTASRVEKAISKLTTPSTILTKHGIHRQNIKTTKLNRYFKRNLS